MTGFFVHIVVQYQYGGDTMSEINFNLRIPEEMNAKLVEIAKAEGRSKNKEIEMILREYINKWESKQK